MADSPSVEGATSGLKNSFFTKKLGPLPMWAIILVGIVGLYYYESKKSKGSATGANQQTDPAGNIGSIDPATGYVYGTPEDNAALAANNAGTGGSTGGTSGTGAGGGAATYVDNNAWASAAINALVARGIDPTSANEAITEYLAGQQLTAQQQSYISLAIDSVGSPPTLPGPVGNPPVATPGPPSTTLPPPPTVGTCSAGFTYSATQTNAAGEVAASGGSGWCEPNPASGGPATVTPPPGQVPIVAKGLKQYTTTGGKSLTQIASQLGTTPENIVSGTSGTDYNQGKAWPYLDDWSKPIPSGIILSYVPGTGNL